MLQLREIASETYFGRSRIISQPHEHLIKHEGFEGCEGENIEKTRSPNTQTQQKRLCTLQTVSIGADLQSPTSRFEEIMFFLPFERKIYILLTRSPVAPLSGGVGRPRILVRAMLVDSPSRLANHMDR